MNIALIYGGNSIEHEISILSTLQLMKYFKEDEITLVYMSKQNKFYIGECLKEYNFYINTNLNKCKEITFERKYQDVYIKSKFKKIKIDMIFPIMHGKIGEDGCIQGFFEILNIPSAESKLSTCAILMDKDLTRKMCTYYNLPIHEGLTLTKEETLLNLEKLKEIDIPKPWILKPSKGGSSIGINCIFNDEQISSKIVETFAFDNKIILEHKIENVREFNIAIVGDEHEQLLSNIEEVHLNDDFYSYTDKYGGSIVKQKPTAKTIPANIEVELENEIKEIALKAYLAFECSGVVRFDFLYDNHLMINEINTIPGSYSIYLFKNICTPDKILEIIKNVAIRQHIKKEKEIKNIDSFVFKKNWYNHVLKK